MRSAKYWHEMYLQEVGRNPPRPLPTEWTLREERMAQQQRTIESLRSQLAVANSSPLYGSPSWQIGQLLNEVHGERTERIAAETERNEMMDALIDAQTELAELKKKHEPKPIDGIVSFIGGGTVSLHIASGALDHTAVDARYRLTPL